MPKLKAAGAVVALCIAGVSADAPASDRSSLFANQLSVLDGRAAQQYRNSTRLRPDSTAVVATAAPRYVGRYRGPFLDMAKAAARTHGVPEDIFLRLVQQESNWNATAVSHKGALGLAQLMPETARSLRIDPLDPRQNLDGGARYLRAQYDRFSTWRLALAAYNAGPNAVIRHGGVPPYRETMNYVVVILGS